MYNYVKPLNYMYIYTITLNHLITLYSYFSIKTLIITHEDPKRKLLKYSLYKDRKTLPSRLRVMVLQSERRRVFGNNKFYVFQKE